MGETFLIARHMGERGTAILKMNQRDAVRIIRENRGSDFQLAVLGGKDLHAVKRVYAEYAPFQSVSSVESLLSYVEEKPLHT